MGTDFSLKGEDYKNGLASFTYEIFTQELVGRLKSSSQTISIPGYIDMATNTEVDTDGQLGTFTFDGDTLP